MRIVSVLSVFLALALPAAAQDVVVYPSGGQTLIDPATGESRIMPPLLQPWQAKPVRLIPPGKHRKRRIATPGPAASPPETSEPPPKRLRHTAEAPPPKPASPKPAVPKAASKPATPASSLSGFADIDLITGGSQQPASQQPAPEPKPAAAPPPKAAAVPPAPAPARTASLQKPASRMPSGIRKGSITFAPDAADPSTAAVAEARSIASTLSTALGNAGTRVSLVAYAGPRGEKSSDTRRLSVKRAKVIRQILIDGGVPPENIDVYALGGTDDDGPLDRVDVFLKS